MATNRGKPGGTIGAMLATRLAAPAAAVLFSVSLAVGADEPPSKPEAVQTTDEAKPDAGTKGEFKPPPGFRTKKRGELILYCRREAVLGSRFQAEKCYDQAGLRALKQAEIEKAELLERIRACGSGSCAAN